LVVLPREFIHCLKVEAIATAPAPAPNGIATTFSDIPKQGLTNFLLTIQFAANSTRMEGFTRNRSRATWITNRIVHITPFHSANGTSTSVKVLAPRCIVVVNVYHWN
jgi:hypothetical protein